MNERIKELVLQAGFSETYGLQEKERLSKLAELIVQECVDICNLTTDRTYLNGIIAGDKIKKHFGVDE
jgi:hypothetical protein